MKTLSKPTPKPRPIERDDTPVNKPGPACPNWTPPAPLNSIPGPRGTRP